MARRSRNDSVRNAHRLTSDHLWSLCLVRRRARPHGLLDVRDGAISFAAIGREVITPTDALASPIDRTRIRLLTRHSACLAAQAAVKKASSPKRTEKIL